MLGERWDPSNRVRSHSRLTWEGARQAAPAAKGQEQRHGGQPCLIRRREPSEVSGHLVTVDAGNRHGRSSMMSPVRSAIWELLSATEYARC